ncbi:cupin domain-containing protein [Neobacillus notoginsengisoli]|uniref:Cupin domain-containing protein n=1 Tax=Neobacillus notoginsengisoli TaxID=1578198 RepID=A0A417YSX8_9BACI|nr:cupin domain-containing protein [Neobacillus notoginsengisoli]RHW39097.1 cupin domain-containing protein [Neobacillus notoginsengisoli]
MYPYQHPYYAHAPMYNYGSQSVYRPFPNEFQYANWLPSSNGNRSVLLKDYGPNPFVININEAAKRNKTYRTALWTGRHFQVTLMSINVGEDIGLEIHPNVDQFLRIEKGQGIVRMGKTKQNLNFERKVSDDSAIMIPAGTWHNVINTGRTPLKLYSIYAPPNHPFGTVHPTKAAAMAAEEGHGNRNTDIFGRTADYGYSTWAGW